FPLSLLVRHRPPCTTRFPYTTLFRSRTEPHQPERQRTTARERSLVEVARQPDRVRRHRDRHGRSRGRGGVDLAGLHVHGARDRVDRKSTRLNSSHVKISYAVFCLKKK